MTVAKWVFQQLGGERRRIELEGWNAPFGRPRQSPVVEDGVELRHNAVYYDGNPEPTVHVFGDKNDDVELNGRFRDRYGGKGAAQVLAEQFKAFTRDGQLTQVTWGDTVSLRGFITKFTPSRESRGEIAWRMTLLVVSDDLADRRPLLGDPEKPTDHAKAIWAAMQALDDARKPLPKLKTSLLDMISGFTDMLMSVTASVANIAGQIESYERAAVGEIKRLRATVRQAQTATVRLVRTYDSLRSDALEVQSANDDLRLEQVRTASQEALSEMGKTLDAAGRQAQQAELGKIRAVYVAIAGDTWEAISRKFYGDPGGAADVREANNIAPGAQPLPGEAYAIPNKKKG